MQTRVLQLKEMIRDVEIVEKEDIPMDNVVRYQSLVTVEMEDGKVLQFKIV
jgi:transcription elongation GreA/GreB family factor